MKYLTFINGFQPISQVIFLFKRNVSQNQKRFYFSLSYVFKRTESLILKDL